MDTEDCGITVGDAVEVNITVNGALVIITVGETVDITMSETLVVTVGRSLVVTVVITMGGLNGHHSRGLCHSG